MRYLSWVWVLAVSILVVCLWSERREWAAEAVRHRLDVAALREETPARAIPSLISLRWCTCGDRVGESPDAYRGWDGAQCCVYHPPRLP